MKNVFFRLLAALALVPFALAASPVRALIDADEPAKGWSFFNGAEFPGARGSLSVAAEDGLGYRPALRLAADFSGGGRYVDAGRGLGDGVAVDTLSFRVKAPESATGLTLRLIDGSGQCHQLPVRFTESGEWRRVVLPVLAYFGKSGTSEAVDIVGRYESWGGAKDGRWHQPLKALHFVVGEPVVGERGEVLIADVRVTEPAEPAGEPIVERILIDGRKTVDGRKRTNGHLFLPEETMDFAIGVLTRVPLPPGSRTARVTVRDYWGAEALAPAAVALAEDGREEGLYRYRGAYTVPQSAAAVGKYHELRVELSPEGFASAEETSGFARLPSAESKRYAPRDIPFQIRNWDSRIREYFELADRLGHRTIGLWDDSGWKDVENLGDDWYTGGFAVGVERDGWTKTTPEEVYRKTFDLVSKHRDDRLRFICQGNEPNEDPAKAKEKVEAYEQVYRAAHAAKPEITVVATSVPPLDCFFEAGFGKWCDVYDFHVYETYEDVRRTLRRYRELGRKYGCEKPVWSTELGLNSQGRPRVAVACELVKKITAFFAEGGASVSWFTIQYPDREGKARGTGGDAHNVFDCRYNLFNPRLDAVMYYTMINGIAVKRFADEVKYDDGVQAFLFRDDADGSFLVLWREGVRVDCGLPLPTAEEIELTRIDGSHSTLVPGDGVVTLGVGPEPVMLRYRDRAAKLPRERASAALAVDPRQDFAIRKGGGVTVEITGPGLKARDLVAELPPRWRADFAEREASVLMTVTAPAETRARTGRVTVRRRTESGVSAEITLEFPVES